LSLHQSLRVAFFHTQKAHSRGLGVGATAPRGGLSLCESFLEANGGKVEDHFVRSSVPRGVRTSRVRSDPEQRLADINTKHAITNGIWY
jgi:hypothetical protein